MPQDGYGIIMISLEIIKKEWVSQILEMSRIRHDIDEFSRN
jgi:hypothetical protein